MATKTLNTRIQLRTDSFAQWTAVDPVLLKGEIAIALVPAEAGSGLHEPCTVIKVGDGTTTYSELPYITALAGDVLTACKTEAGLTKFIEDVLVSAGVLSGDEEGQEQSLAERVTGAEEAIDALQKADDAIRAEIAAKLTSVYKASGSIASSTDLPTADENTVGNVYNVTTGFTTTADFVEGAGKDVPAGSNVVVVQTKAAQGNGFDGDFKTAYNITGASGTYEVYINGNTINGASFSPSIFSNSTVQQVVDNLNSASSNDVANYAPYTFSGTTGEIFDKDGNTVEFMGYSKISPIKGVPAEYGYDVVGTLVDLTDYYTKSEVDALIPEAVKDALEPTTNEEGEEEKSPLLEKVEGIINEEIAKLDVEDDGEAGFVQKVTQTDGLIAVVKKVLESTDISDFEAAVASRVQTAFDKPVYADPENPTEEELEEMKIYEELLAEVKKMIDEALGVNGEGGSEEGLAKTITEIVEKAILDAGDPDADPATEASALNTAVKTVVTGELDTLDYTNTDEGVVTSVSQTDGLISVVKKVLEATDISDFTKVVKETIQTAVTEPKPVEDPENPGETIEPNPVDVATYDAIVNSVVNIVMEELSKKTVAGEGGEGTEEVPVNEEFYDTIREIVAEMVSEAIVNGKDGADGKDGVTTTIIKSVIDELKDAGGQPVEGGEDGEVTEPSELNKTVNEMIDGHINELNVTDTEVEGEVVVAVSQNSGKIEVTRKKLTLADLSNDETEDADQIVFDCGGAGA